MHGLPSEAQRVPTTGDPKFTSQDVPPPTGYEDTHAGANEKGESIYTELIHKLKEEYPDLFEVINPDRSTNELALFLPNIKSTQKIEQKKQENKYAPPIREKLILRSNLIVTEMGIFTSELNGITTFHLNVPELNKFIRKKKQIHAASDRPYSGPVPLKIFNQYWESEEVHLEELDIGDERVKQVLKETLDSMQQDITQAREAKRKAVTNW